MTRKTNTGERGIYNRGKGTRPFEASISLTRKKSNKLFTLHIGSWPTLEEAIIRRREFINTL